MRHTLHLIIGILIALWLVCLLVLFVAWICIPKEAIKVKFSDFEKWYYLAPRTWRLKDFYVTRYDYDVYFGFFGTIPYMIWKLQVDKRAKKSFENQQMKKLLSSIQSDIDAVREESNRELRKAQLMMDKIKHI